MFGLLGPYKRTSLIKRKGIKWIYLRTNQSTNQPEGAIIWFKVVEWCVNISYSQGVGVHETYCEGPIIEWTFFVKCHLKWGEMELTKFGKSRLFRVKSVLTFFRKMRIFWRIVLTFFSEMRLLYSETIAEPTVNQGQNQFCCLFRAKIKEYDNFSKIK